jgi:hypothetical protein
VPDGVPVREGLHRMHSLLCLCSDAVNVLLTKVVESNAG